MNCSRGQPCPLSPMLPATWKLGLCLLFLIMAVTFAYAYGRQVDREAERRRQPDQPHTYRFDEDGRILPDEEPEL